MRIGIIVPRHGHTAVARNLLKRRLREIARLELLPQQLPLDIVIRTAEPAYGLPYSDLREQVTGLVRRAAGA
jgi:ribonuclease P protein component